MSEHEEHLMVRPLPFAAEAGGESEKMLSGKSLQKSKKAVQNIET